LKEQLAGLSALGQTYGVDTNLLGKAMGVPAEHCVAGFEYGTTADGGKRLVKIGTAANPATTAASGATNDRTFHSRRGTAAQVSPALPFNLEITVK
jgi:hypothetical protein